MPATMAEVGDYLKPLMLKDLRTQCRARCITPAGSRDALVERLAEHMLATQDFTIFTDANPAPAGSFSADPRQQQTSLSAADEPGRANNYSRPDGQNVGNFLSERPTSRVLAPPGGSSQVYFGGYGSSPPRQAPSQGQSSPALADVSNQAVPQQPAGARQPTPKVGAAQPQQQGGHFSGHGMSDGHGAAVNNYSRSEGQNVGNFLSDRPTSRVLAPPGGASQVFFG